MIQLDNYGYCLEEYIYDLQDNNIREISYILHDEKGNNCAVVGVYRLNGKPIRSIILWPSINPKENNDISIDEEIPDMKLYLDCVDKKFNFDDIQVFSYNSSNNKDEEGFTTSFNLENNRQDIDIYTCKDNILVYNKASNMIKTYKSTQNDEIDYNSHIESIRLTDFGAIMETVGDNVISTVSNGYSKVYEYQNTNSIIESLRIIATNVIIENDITYNISYDRDHMVQRVTLNESIFSRSETEEFIFKNKGKVGQVTDSIYPTLITDNYQNYKYKFMKLWTHDKMKKNEKDEVTFFQRKIYVLKDCDDLLAELRKNTNRLCINR